MRLEGGDTVTTKERLLTLLETRRGSFLSGEEAARELAVSRAAVCKAVKALRQAGFEYGAKTGRPRRVGPIDLVATRYGVQVQAATNIALTKLDVLSYLDKIPVCAHYELNGEVIDEFPFPTLQSSAKPVMEYMEGWKCDISGVRKWEDLPEAARNYVQYVEEKIGCRIGYVSVGPERDSIIIR